MNYFDNEKTYHPDVYTELDELIARHSVEDRAYEDQNKFKTFMSHWEPKRIIYNQEIGQFILYVTGKTHERYQFILSKFQDKGSIAVSSTYDLLKDLIMQDLGERKDYKLFTGRISDHFANEYKMRQTEIEFCYIQTPETVEVIHLWCGGVLSVWRRQNNRGHFKLED
jgi:hypothetical protein